VYGAQEAAMQAHTAQFAQAVNTTQASTRFTAAIRHKACGI
jgi:hypothetical protein